MSEQPASDPGAAASPGMGGKRVSGQRNASNQTKRDASIRVIKEKWGVNEFVDIFPRAIRPEGDLGDSAIANLRGISTRVPNLQAARLLMIAECKDSKGNPTKLSFKNTSHILNQLKENEAEPVTKKGEKQKEDDVLPKLDVPKKPAAIPKNAAKGGNLVTPLTSVPAKGSAGESASRSDDALMESKLAATMDHSRAKRSAPGETLMPAKSILMGKTSALSHLKAPSPNLQTARTGGFGPRLDFARLRGKKTEDKEIAYGLHAPKPADVAPFSGKVISTAKKTTPKKRVSFALDDETDFENSHSQSSAKAHVSREAGSGISHPLTDVSVGHNVEAGRLRKRLEANIKKGQNASLAKRLSEGGGEPASKMLKFSKESILEELNFKKRPSPKTDYLAADNTPAKDDTDTVAEALPRLLAENMAIKHGLGSIKRKVSSDEPEEKMLFDKVAASEMTVGGPGEGSKVLKSIAPRGSLARPKFCMRKPSATPAKSTFKKPDEEDVIMKESFKVTQTSKYPLDSPRSPVNSPEREESINSSPARRLAEFHNSKRSRIAGSFSPTSNVDNTPSKSPDKASSKMSTKLGHESSTPKKNIMDPKVDEVVEHAEERSPKSGLVDDPLSTPKATSIAAKRASGAPKKPSSTLPKLPDTLTARIPADRALICSIPGIVKAYIKELQAAIPDGKGPDGDLLSMIIVNKYGYFLDHLDDLDKDLISLYYQAVDRDAELERESDGA